MDYDTVIPLFKVRWSTPAVLEGVVFRYEPRRICVICPKTEVMTLEKAMVPSGLTNLEIYPEESFFTDKFQIAKEQICGHLDLEASLYPPGWFYQQILKLGAHYGVPDLSDPFLIWDSDLLPLASWPVLETESLRDCHLFALLQDNKRGNQNILEKWERWIRKILEVEPLTDPEGSLIPHHMWFDQSTLGEIFEKLRCFYDSDDPWPLLMMRSANDFGTFSEFWLYASWMAAHHSDRLHYYPYGEYGETTERFFDDGTGPFFSKLRQAYPDTGDYPSYERICEIVTEEYKDSVIPSSLSFESSPRHLKKGKENMHTEELRSRWHSAI